MGSSAHDSANLERARRLSQSPSRLETSRQLLAKKLMIVLVERGQPGLERARRTLAEREQQHMENVRMDATEQYRCSGERRSRMGDDRARDRVNGISASPVRVSLAIRVMSEDRSARWRRRYWAVLRRRSLFAAERRRWESERALERPVERGLGLVPDIGADVPDRLRRRGQGFR